MRETIEEKFKGFWSKINTGLIGASMYDEIKQIAKSSFTYGYIDGRDSVKGKGSCTTCHHMLGVTCLKGVGKDGYFGFDCVEWESKQ